MNVSVIVLNLDDRIIDFIFAVRFDFDNLSRKIGVKLYLMQNDLCLLRCRVNIAAV